jgi:NAD(P)-dependent dehydrogenase (short-subunit alcohol dehydrogenase family)
MRLDSTETSFKLQDRTAILTGPCNSFNQAIAYKFTQLGANVALIDSNIDKLQRFANQLTDAREVNERYGRATAIQSELSNPKKVIEAVTKAAEAFGGIDIFIDGFMTTAVKRFRDPLALEDLDKMIDQNLRATLLTTHGVLRFLESRKRGRIIYLMHDLARMGFPQNSLMAVTRSGLSAFARTLAREAAEFNITVNCVAMGTTEEFLLSQVGTETVSIQEAQGRLLQIQPNAQMIETEKIANMVAFLASPLGSGITGQTIAVSQGMSLMT